MNKTDTIRFKRTSIRADDEREAMSSFKHYMSKDFEVVRFVSIIQNPGGAFYWDIVADVEKKENVRPE